MRPGRCLQTFPVSFYFFPLLGHHLTRSWDAFLDLPRNQDFGLLFLISPHICPSDYSTAINWLYFCITPLTRIKSRQKLYTLSLFLKHIFSTTFLKEKAKIVSATTESTEAHSPGENVKRRTWSELTQGSHLCPFLIAHSHTPPKLANLPSLFSSWTTVFCLLLLLYY